MANGFQQITPTYASALLTTSGSSPAFELPKETATSNVPSEADSVIAVYERHDDAERAIRKLQAGGIDMKSLSIVGRDPELKEHVAGYYTVGDRMLHWGQQGAFWGALWGMLFDSALFAIPGIGTVLLAGPLVSWIVAVLEGAVVVGGLSAVGAALVSIGIPKHSVIAYESALRINEFLLIVHGPRNEVDKAKEIIGGTHPKFHTVHGERVLDQ